MKNKPKTVRQQALEYIRYWQKYLRLMDWKFQLKVATKVEDCSGFGNNRHSPNFQHSLITVLDPAVIPKDWNGCKDLEVTVVHEMVHTRFLYAIPSKKTNWHEEMAIETVSIALVANRRGISPEELE